MANAKTHFEVRNKVTGYIFKLLKADCDKLVLEEPHNFEVIDKDYVKPITENKEKTVYSQIVEDETHNGDTNEVKPISEYDYKELKAYCKKYNLDTSGKTEDLKQRVLDYDKKLADLLVQAKDKGIDINQNPITVEELEKLLEND